MMRPSISAAGANQDGYRRDNSPQPAADFWVPTLRKLQAFGPVYQNRFEWPTLNQLKSFNLRKQMKLVSIEIGASSSLYGLRFHFSNAIASPYVHASAAREQDYQRYDLDTSRRLSDIYIN